MSEPQAPPSCGNVGEILGIRTDPVEIQTWVSFYEDGRGNRVLSIEKLHAAEGATPGTGSSVMRDICAYADRHGIEVTCGLADKGDFKSLMGWKTTTSRSRVRRFYQRFGFRNNAAAGRFELRGTMHRPPLVRR